MWMRASMWVRPSEWIALQPKSKILGLFSFSILLPLLFTFFINLVTYLKFANSFIYFLKHDSLTSTHTFLSTFLSLSLSVILTRSHSNTANSQCIQVRSCLKLPVHSTCSFSRSFFSLLTYLQSHDMHDIEVQMYSSFKQFLRAFSVLTSFCKYLNHFFAPPHFTLKTAIFIATLLLTSWLFSLFHSKWKWKWKKAFWREKNATFFF